MRANEFIGSYDTPDSSISLDPHRGDYEIRNYHKLDKYLSDLCDLVERGQQSKHDFGMVAAGLLPLKGDYMARLNRPGADGRRIHAEHAVIEDFLKKYGSIPEGTVIITTLSPCNTAMDERDGPSCADLLNHYGIQKVYCGYIDPTQADGAEDDRQYNLVETQNKELRTRCEAFADTFLDKNSESLDEYAADGDGDDGEEDILLKYARMWYQGDLETQLHVEKILDRMGWEIGELESEEGGCFVVRSGDDDGHSYIGFAPDDLTENFKDGRNPQDTGDSARHGIPKHASISTLRKIAKQGGRKGQLAHWQANMRSGRNKHK
jgi:pyrimidine deaminase RibD-like protein